MTLFTYKLLIYRLSVLMWQGSCNIRNIHVVIVRNKNDTVLPFQVLYVAACADTTRILCVGGDPTIELEPYPEVPPCPFVSMCSVSTLYFFNIWICVTSIISQTSFDTFSRNPSVVYLIQWTKYWVTTMSIDIYLFFLHFYFLTSWCMSPESYAFFPIFQELLCCSFGEQTFAHHSVRRWFQKYLIFLPLEY